MMEVGRAFQWEGTARTKTGRHTKYGVMREGPGLRAGQGEGR